LLQGVLNIWQWKCKLSPPSRWRQASGTIRTSQDHLLLCDLMNFYMYIH
jgi:hypothetical protein